MLVEGAGVDTLVRMSRFFRLRGRLNDTRGGLGMAFSSLRDVWRIGRCFLTIFGRLERQGWNVTTKGVLCSGCFGGWGCKVSVRGVLAAFWICWSIRCSL